MNTRAEYRRHLQPAPATATPDLPDTEQGRRLGIHGDPSLTALAQTPTTATGRRIAWVRPTELHAHADRLIGRGVDLHTELTRRARGVPRTASQTVGRAATRSVRQTPPILTRPGLGRPAPTPEGIEL